MEQGSLPDNSLKAYRAVSKEFETVYTMYAKTCGLSDTEFWSLLTIRSGAKTQAEICDQLFLSPQTINSAFKQLVKKGLVRLEPLEHNQRTKQIILTPLGQQFVEQHIDRIRNVECQMWEAMEEQERAMLIRFTRKYCNLIKAALEQSSTIEYSSSEDISSQ